MAHSWNDSGSRKRRIERAVSRAARTHNVKRERMQVRRALRTAVR